MEEIYNYIIQKHKLIKVSLIGKGGYGTVYLVKKENNVFAMKIINLEKKGKNKHLLNESINSIQQELSWSKNMNSLYCVNTLSIYKDEVHDYIIFSMVMEIAKYNNLMYFIKYYYRNNFLWLNNEKMNKLNILTMKFFIYQIFQSLLFLKEHLLVHCDIKLDNYLLFNYFILKLSDFSCMRLLNLNDDLQLKSTTWNIKGKEYFTNDKKVNFSNAFKVDIYCTGAMIYKLRYNNYIIDKKLKEFFINEKISPEEKIDKIEKQIKNAIVLIKNDNVNEDFKKLLISMIECDINDRPNIENLLNDKWINEDHEIINKIKSINETEEIKIFLEFEKHKIIKRKRKKFTFNKK